MTTSPQINDALAQPVPRTVPTAHAVTERAQLIMARRHAEAIRRDAELVDRARTAIDEILSSHRRTTGHVLWQRLLASDLTEMLRRLVADNADGRLLRSNSPFPLIIPDEDEQQRRLTWRQAKKELSASAI